MAVMIRIGMDIKMKNNGRGIGIKMGMKRYTGVNIETGMGMWIWNRLEVEYVLENWDSDEDWHMDWDVDLNGD